MDLSLERSLNHWLCSINHNAQERIEKESPVNRVTSNEKMTRSVLCFSPFTSYFSSVHCVPQCFFVVPPFTVHHKYPIFSYKVDHA